MDEDDGRGGCVGSVGRGDLKIRTLDNVSLVHRMRKVGVAKPLAMVKRNFIAIFPRHGTTADSFSSNEQDDNLFEEKRSRYVCRIHRWKNSYQM